MTALVATPPATAASVPTRSAAAVGTATTDSSGAYEMTLAAGAYVLCEELQDDWAQSAPSPPTRSAPCVDPDAGSGHAVTVVDGVDQTGKDFGNFAGIVSGIKFNDDEPDASKTGDAGIAGWKIYAFADANDNGDLDAGEDASGRTATTASDGTYKLALQDGDYLICEEDQAGWTQTVPVSGTADCSPVAGYGDEGYQIQDLDTTDPEYVDTDFGNNQPAAQATVSGLKFDDENEDAFNDADPDDPPLEGWVINAYADDGNGAADRAACSTPTRPIPAGEYELTLDRRRLRDLRGAPGRLGAVRPRRSGCRRQTAPASDRRRAGGLRASRLPRASPRTSISATTPGSFRA